MDPSDSLLGARAVVEDWLYWRSITSPRQLAVRCGSVQWTYEELNERVNNLAGLFFSWGIKKGERVGLLLNPSERYVASVHALTRIGAVTVPLNVRLSPPELLWQLRDCRPSLIIYDSEPAFSQMKERIERLKVGGKGHRWRSSAELKTDSSNRRRTEKPSIDPSSMHSIIYTSGSEGTPKGVEITVSNLLWNAISVGLRSGLSQDDRWLLVLPLFHVGGYTMLFRSVLHGSSVVLRPRFVAADVSKSLDNDGITLVSLIPTMMDQLLEVRRGRPFPPNLRQIFLGGSPPSLSLTRTIRERGLPVLITYGMTETCSQVAISELGPSTEQNGQISYRPVFPATFAIKSRNRIVAKREVPGEILVQSPTIFRRYWHQPSATSRAFDDGWFCTGDVGFLNLRGEIVVLGRKEDVIKSGGENIYPAEVESALLEHEAIEDAVVIGREDRRWGQRVEAVVKVAEASCAPSPSELTDFLREKIGRYKIPKRYHFWPSIPKTSTGKTVRQAVREALEREDVPGASELRE